jgi:DNA polymerase-3 subunit delta
MSSTQRILRDAVRDGTFASAYYLFGEDDFLKEQAVRQLLEAAVDPATRDFNLETRRASEIDAETLGSLLGTPPMMAERRVLVLRDVGSLRKDARAVLDAYLETPASDAIVILVAPAGTKTDRALSARATALEFEPLTGDRVPKWIAYHAEHELRTGITPAAISLLESAVGSDLPLLAIELDKLASYAVGRTIDEDAVTAIVGVRREETIGQFLDAVAARDASRALELLPGALAQPKASAVTIVMALTVQTIAIAWAQARRRRGLAGSRVTGELFGLLKEAGGVFTARPWGEAVDAWARAAARLDAEDADDVDTVLSTLLAADQALKETRLSSDEQLLTNLVLTLCSGSVSGRTPAADPRARRTDRMPTAEHA